MLHRRCRFQDFYGWIVLIIIITYYVPAKLCNQRKTFSHDVEINNKGILHFYICDAPVRGANPDRPRDKQNTVWVFIGIIDESLLQHFVSNEICVSARIKIV